LEWENILIFNTPLFGVLIYSLVGFAAAKSAFCSTGAFRVDTHFEKMAAGWIGGLSILSNVAGHIHPFHVWNGQMSTFPAKKQLPLKGVQNLLLLLIGPREPPSRGVLGLVVRLASR